MQVCQHRPHLGAGEDGRQAPWRAGSQHAHRHLNGEFQDVAIEIEEEEEDGAAGLVLRRRGDVVLGGEVDQKGLDFRATHLAGMALLVKQNVATHPVDVALLGAVSVVACAQDFARIVQ